MRKGAKRQDDLNEKVETQKIHLT